MSEKGKRTAFFVEVEPEFHKEVRVLAAERGEKIANIVRRGIALELDRLKGAATADG